MASDAEREVDLLWLQTQDLAAQDVDGWFVILEGPSEQSLVSFVAAVDRVGQIQIDESRFDEVGPALVFCLAQRGGVGRGEVEALERALGGHVVAERPVVVGVVGDVGAAGPGRALPELARLCVGPLLGRVEAGVVGFPGRTRAGRRRDRVLGRDVGAVESLGRGVKRLGAEPHGLTLIVRGVDIAGSAGVDRQDRDRLAELTEAGDEATT